MKLCCFLQRNSYFKKLPVNINIITDDITSTFSYLEIKIQNLILSPSQISDHQKFILITENVGSVSVKITFAHHSITNPNNQPTLRISSAGGDREPDTDRDRGDRLGQDYADHPVPGRGGVHCAGQDRLHTAATCGRHERGQASGGGVWLPSGPGGRVHHPFRGLHQPGDCHKVSAVISCVC